MDSPQPDKRKVVDMERGLELSRVSPALATVFDDYLTSLDKRTKLETMTPETAYSVCIQRATVLGLRKKVAHAIKQGRVSAAALAPSMERNRDG